MQKTIKALEIFFLLCLMFLLIYTFSFVNTDNALNMFREPFKKVYLISLFITIGISTLLIFYYFFEKSKWITFIGWVLILLGSILWSIGVVNKNKYLVTISTLFVALGAYGLLIDTIISSKEILKIFMTIIICIHIILFDLLLWLPLYLYNL